MFLLLKLKLKNFMILKECSLDFSEGLIVFTGESGSGKSLLLEAIFLLLGSSANQHFIHLDADQATIEGVFQFTKVPTSLVSFLDENKQLIVRRIISKDRANSIFLNDTVVSLKHLKSIAKDLAESTSQHDHLQLFNVDYQLSLFDQLVGKEHFELISHYQIKFNEYSKLKSKLSILLSKKENASKEIEFLTFQLNDLQTQNFLPDEYETLLNQKKLVKGLKKTNDIIRNIVNKINSSFQLSSEAFELCSRLDDEIQKKLPFERLNTLQHEANDLFHSFSAIQLDLDSYSHMDIDQVDSRLDTIFTYMSKFNVSHYRHLIDKINDLKADISLYTTLDSQISSINHDIALIETALSKYSKQIHDQRLSFAPKFSSSIQTHLHDLGIDSAKFFVKIDESNSYNFYGKNDLQFLISTIPGAPMLPLNKNLSGGELSRLLLSLKVSFCSSLAAPIALFDEVDTGVGGLIALQLGKKLQLLSQSSQVFCVTHLPQLAKFAAQHIVVSKSFLNGVPNVTLATLDKTSSSNEILRMIGGNEIKKLIK